MLTPWYKFFWLCPVFALKSAVSCFNRTKFGIKIDLDWQIVNKLPINLFFYDTSICSHLCLFLFWRCKIRHSCRLLYSTLYNLKKIFLSERLFLPHFFTFYYYFGSKSRDFGSILMSTWYQLYTDSLLFSTSCSFCRCKSTCILQTVIATS